MGCAASTKPNEVNIPTCKQDELSASQVKIMKLDLVREKAKKAPVLNLRGNLLFQQRHNQNSLTSRTEDTPITLERGGSEEIRDLIQQ